jgi:hypothetical protein
MANKRMHATRWGLLFYFGVYSFGHIVWRLRFICG